MHDLFGGKYLNLRKVCAEKKMYRKKLKNTKTGL